MQKLFIVVRADLDLGLQMAQVGHAVAQFIHYNPNEYRAWFYGPDFKGGEPAGPNNIVVKHIANEAELLALVSKAASTSMGVASFQEPDLGGQTTAAAFGGPGAQQLLWKLPLARFPQAAAA